MRIAILCPHFEDTGGVREVVAHLAKEHVRAGHRVDIVTRARSRRAAPPSPLAEEVGLHRIPIAPAPHRGSGWRQTRQFLRRFLQGAAPLASRLRKIAPDVVATHCSKFHAPWVMTARATLPAPVVVHLHNAERTADGPPSPFWSRRLLGSAHHVIAVSMAVGEFAVRVRPELTGHVDVIRNGVDPGDFDGVQPEVRPEPYLLAVGRLAQQKGFDVLLDALATATHQALLVVAGDGPDAERLRAQAIRLGLASNVEFLGEVPRERVKQLLRGATAVVMPSRFEGNPLVAIEAMQAGAPLIATAIPGLPDELADDATGVLVPPEDAASLARAIDRVLGDLGRAKALGRAAAATAGGMPTWRAVADAVLAVYARVAHST